MSGDVAIALVCWVSVCDGITLTQLSVPFSTTASTRGGGTYSLCAAGISVDLFPIVIIFKLSFPPVFFRLLLSLTVF